MQNEEKKKKLLTENSSVMNIIRLGITRKLFRKYLSNQANTKEQQMIESWDAETYWSRYLKKTPDSELEKGCKEVWEQVSNQIHAENPSVEYGQYPVIKKTTRIVRISFSHAIRKYAAVAAIFLLVAGTTIFFVTQQTNSCTFTDQQALAKTCFQTGTSSMKTVTLPDGSKITLNSETKLSIIENQFNCKLREVWLSGEAFFEVAKNPEKPFIIHTGSMQTTVCGTSFNVKAYPQLSENVVSVRTGKVKISQQGKQLAVLIPNEQIIYNTLNNRFETGVADGENAAGWRNGRLIFNSANIEELKLRLKQQYHVDLIIQNKALKDIMFNSSFAKGTSLNEVMNTIADFYHVNYNITSSGQVILSE